MFKRLVGILAFALFALPAASAWADSCSDTANLFRKAGQSAQFFKTAYGYAVFPTIGKGGLGESFKARYAALDKPVTFKRLHNDQFANPDARQDFFRRSMTTAQLSHPHLAGVRDAGLLGETAYLAREFVPGVDLDRVVRETGFLPVARACARLRSK